MAEIFEDIAMSRLLLEMMPIAASAAAEEEIVAGFSKSISSFFGIDEVLLYNIKDRTDKQLDDYLINTKKPYVDNLLSAYSAFPEFIEFKNNGFKSCAMVPLIADGKVHSILRMLSKKENCFSDGMLRSVSFVASFMSFALMYKSEKSKNLRLASYFDASFGSPFSQFLVSSDGTVIKNNKSAVKEFGISINSQMNVKNLFGVDFSRLSTARTPITVTGGKNENRIYSISAQPISSNLIHMSVSDITDQYSYLALNSAFSASRETCLIVLDASFTIKNMSDNSEHVFGYSKNVFLNSNFIDLVKKGDQQSFRSRVFSVAQNQAIAETADLSLGDAGQRFMRCAITRIPNGFLMLVTRADYEKGILEMKKDLENFTESSSEMVIGVDEIGYIRSCNMSIEQALGYKKDEIIGTEIKALYDQKEILDRDISYVKNGGKVDNSYFNLIAKDSHLVPATHSVRMMSAVDEDSPKYLFVIKELESKARLREQADEIRKQQTEINRLKADGQLKSQFLYNISHELKTPLTNIKGFSTLMYNGEFGKLNSDQMQYLSTIMSEAERLTTVIQQVLEAAKLEAEKVKLDYKQVDIRAMAENPTIKSLEESARNKGLSFEWKVDFDVPEIAADPNRLIQVIVNLVGNSIKFTNSGSITVRAFRERKKYVKFEVSDTGIGINEEDRRKLFKKKFFEAAKKGLVQQPGAGTGLGLSITKDIVKLHHGNVGVESTVGKGSKFWFTLPIAQQQRKKTQPQTAQ
jgi:PAS domain S-box-containing protein